MGYSMHATVPVILKQRLHPEKHEADTWQRCSGPITHYPIPPLWPKVCSMLVNRAAFLA